MKQRKLKLFLSVSPLDFVAINIPGPLHKTKTGGKYVLLITDSYSKLAMTVLKTKTTATGTVSILTEH